MSWLHVYAECKNCTVGRAQPEAGPDAAAGPAAPLPSPGRKPALGGHAAGLGRGPRSADFAPMVAGTCVHMQGCLSLPFFGLNLTTSKTLSSPTGNWERRAPARSTSVKPIHRKSKQA